MTEGTAKTEAATPPAGAAANQAATPGAASATDVGAVGGVGGKGGSEPSGPVRSNKYGALVGLVITVLLVLGLWFWPSIPSGSGAHKYPLAWFIIIAAILGAVVNEPYRNSEPRGTTYGWIAAYIFWKGAVSIVFAFLLYLMAIGGLVGGELFPEFVATALPADQHWNMEAFATRVDPKDYKDIARLLVWSFIAGYSERFVPNLIGKILKTSEDGAKKRV